MYTYLKVGTVVILRGAALTVHKLETPEFKDKPVESSVEKPEEGLPALKPFEQPEEVDLQATEKHVEKPKDLQMVKPEEVDLQATEKHVEKPKDLQMLKPTDLPATEKHVETPKDLETEEAELEAKELQDLKPPKPIESHSEPKEGLENTATDLKPQTMAVDPKIEVARAEEMAEEAKVKKLMAEAKVEKIAEAAEVEKLAAEAKVEKIAEAAEVEKLVEGSNVNEPKDLKVVEDKPQKIPVPVKVPSKSPLVAPAGPDPLGPTSSYYRTVDESVKKLDGFTKAWVDRLEKDLQNLLENGSSALAVELPKQSFVAAPKTKAQVSTASGTPGGEFDKVEEKLKQLAEEASLTTEKPLATELPPAAVTTTTTTTAAATTTTAAAPVTIGEVDLVEKELQELAEQASLTTEKPLAATTTTTTTAAATTAPAVTTTTAAPVTIGEVDLVEKELQELAENAKPVVSSTTTPTTHKEAFMEKLAVEGVVKPLEEPQPLKIVAEEGASAEKNA